MEKGAAMKNTRRLILLGLLVSQALILSIVESWIPLPVAIPGVKLGLANIITLIAIIFFGFREAFLIMCIRVLLSSLYGGGWVVFWFSLAGGILSTIMMGFLYKWASKVFSIIGISIAGSIMHNVGQLIAASIVMRELSVMGYLPVLLVSGIIMGCFVGLCTNFLTKALEKTRILS
jgi:heptaprenyl diphosphate synthase